MDSNTKEESSISELLHQTMDYVDTRIDLFKLRAIQKLTEGASSILSKIIVGGIFIIAFALLSIGLAIYIGKLLGETEYGFFVVGGGVIVAGIIFYALRHKLVKAPISASFIKKGLK